MPHESVLDSLAPTFDAVVPGWDDSDPDKCQSTSFGSHNGPQAPADPLLAAVAHPERPPMTLVAS